MTGGRRRHKAKSTSISEICGLSGIPLRDWDHQNKNSVLNNTVYRKGKDTDRVKFRFWIRGGICYTYVHPNSYRGAYRFLLLWQQKWGNYERRHQSDETGLLVDPRRPPHVSLEELRSIGIEIPDSRPLLQDTNLSEEEKNFAMMPPSEFIKAVNGRLVDRFRNFRQS